MVKLVASCIISLKVAELLTLLSEKLTVFCFWLSDLLCLEMFSYYYQCFICLMLQGYILIDSTNLLTTYYLIDMQIV